MIVLNWWLRVGEQHAASGQAGCLPWTGGSEAMDGTARRRNTDRINRHHNAEVEIAIIVF